MILALNLCRKLSAINDSQGDWNNKWFLFLYLEIFMKGYFSNILEK